VKKSGRRIIPPSCQFFRYVNKKWARSPLSVRPQRREPNNFALQNHLAPQHGVRIRNSPYAPNHFVHTRRPTPPRRMCQLSRELCLQDPEQNDMAPFSGAKNWKSLLTHTGTPWNSIGFAPSRMQKSPRSPARTTARTQRSARVPCVFCGSTIRLLHLPRSSTFRSGVRDWGNKRSLGSAANTKYHR